MQVQWRVLNGNPDAEVCQVLEQTVKLTVPDADKIKLSQRVLSVQEYFAWLEKKTTLAPIFGMYGLVMTSAASRLEK